MLNFTILLYLALTLIRMFGIILFMLNIILPYTQDWLVMSGIAIGTAIVIIWMFKT